MANSYKNAAVVLSSTGATNLYTCPAATRAIVQSVNVANIDGSDRYVTITWYDASSGSSYTLLNNALIPPGTAMNAIDAAVVLEAGDIIRCQAATANTLHVTASILEQDPTSAFPEQSVTTTKIANNAVTSAKIVDNAVTSAKMATGVSPTIICTSSTRPASPFAGQQIYETDTQRILIYSGSVWQPPWNTSWGIVGVGTKSDGAQVPANTSFCSVTFTPVLNRYYSAFYTSRTIWTAGGSIGIYDSVAAGRIAEQYGAPDPVTLQRTKTFSTTASRTLSILTDGVQTPISGSYSGQERPAQLVVTDVGPA